MKIGDYVRTYHLGGSIEKIIEIVPKERTDDLIERYITDISAKYMQSITAEQIIKSSPNIIDLIEVGDYVNGYPVAKIYKSVNKDIGRVIEYETDNVGGYEYEAEDLWESHIKSISIVTKEQFKNMEYKYDR